MMGTNQFRVHGQLPLHGMTIRESEDEWGVPHAFTLVGQQQSMVVAACALLPSSPDSLSSSNDLLTFPECPEDSSVEAESEDDVTASRISLERPSLHRGNTMVHVCWHRNTSVSALDFSLAVEVPARAQTSTSDLPLLSRLTVFLFPVSVCRAFTSGTVSSCVALHRQTIYEIFNFN
ncbi:FERM, RhoGEF and pleckstrin domain-containing protein 1 [Liparis tanakae]|uniref:FERM, RhoGEF and pleckstrin domain-containing protein 1 n=1 Tax=Liparis tanakae TaxID=230148 RepID=A0A4Z2EMR4_9TELE|nr:FERM, RhoGEF and pleckstrin domain-containing protein 1 [Liparis tanakae]